MGPDTKIEKLRDLKKIKKTKTVKKIEILGFGFRVRVEGGGLG